jgi:hypothetical protein
MLDQPATCGDLGDALGREILEQRYFAQARFIN